MAGGDAPVSTRSDAPSVRRQRRLSPTQRDGAVGESVAVTQLVGRAFPGVHIQGDTFANLQQQVTDVAGRYVEIRVMTRHYMTLTTPSMR